MAGSSIPDIASDPEKGILKVFLLFIFPFKIVKQLMLLIDDNETRT